LQSWHEDFRTSRKLNLELILIVYPFSAGIDTVSDDLQLELNDMQSDHTLKRLCNSSALTKFYKSLSSNAFLRLEEFCYENILHILMHINL